MVECHPKLGCPRNEFYKCEKTCATNPFTNYGDEEEGYQNYGRNNPFAMLSFIVFYLVIALSIYAFMRKKSYLTPTNMGIGIILLLVTGGSAMG